MTHSITHMAVLIPARNEELLLPRCLRSVIRAKGRLPRHIRCEIVVAVDSSTDRTYEIARTMLDGIVLKTDAGNVGIARSLAADAAIAHLACAPETLWLANTDADCDVPPHWLVDQLLLAQSGAQAVAGIVDVDNFSEHRDGVAERFRESYLIHADGTHPHVHGANIGMRGDVYLRAGGWSALATAEDHDLWNRISAFSRARSVAALRVVTSGRRLGRAPSGFAGALAAHNEAVL